MNFIDKLKSSLNLSDEIYQEMITPTSSLEVEDPNNFLNIDIATSRILKAITNNEPIMIYGDYDCDGICSTSILVETFKKLNYKVGYYIPSRYVDGYGINVDMVNKIALKGYKLIITVDNGVSQIEALTLAKEKGIDVILTDHHEILNQVPPCFTIVHPFYKNKEVIPQCGAYVSFMLSIKLLGKIDDYLLSLASLATISDMMPLVKDNRTIVKKGLETINSNKFLQFMRLSNNDIDEKELGFNIAPKINALGRVKEDFSVNNVVKYFTSNEKKDILNLALYIDEVNEERKLICSQAYNSLHIEKNDDKVIICLFDDLKEGLIGLVAAKILNAYNKPTIVFTRSSNGLLKGSGRSLEGFSLAQAFKDLKDVIEVYGGHALAGGLSIKEENFNQFKERINLLSKDVVIVPKSKIVIPLEKDEFTYENYLELRKLAPFGEGNEEPYFSYTIECSMIRYIGNRKQHAKGSINSNCSFIYFNADKDLISCCKKVTLIGKIEKDKYLGYQNLSFNVVEIKKED